MIQRIQSVWLLLAAICAFATYSLPVYTGTLQDNNIRSFLVSDNFLLFPLVFGTGLLALIILFLYKNRKLQFRLCMAGILLAILSIIVEYTKAEDFKQANTFRSGSYQIGALLPFLIVILFILAARNIYKDEKLVKSLNRLR